MDGDSVNWLDRLLRSRIVKFIARLVRSRLFTFLAIMTLTMMIFEGIVIAITGEGIPLGGH